MKDIGSLSALYGICESPQNTILIMKYTPSAKTSKKHQGYTKTLVSGSSF